MTARELGSRVRGAIEGDGSSSANWMRYGIAGIAMCILMVVVTQTSPRQVESITLQHKEAIKEQAAAYKETISAITQEMKDDRTAMTVEFGKMRDTISDKLEENNQTQRMFLQKLIGLNADR